MARSAGKKATSQSLEGKSVYFYVKVLSCGTECVRGPYMRKNKARNGERLEEYALIKFN